MPSLDGTIVVGNLLPAESVKKKSLEFSVLLSIGARRKSLADKCFPRR